MDLLNTIFRLMPSGNYVNIWQLKMKSSFWFNDISKINPDDSPQLYSKGCVYFGLGTTDKAKGRFERCFADDVNGIGAIWLDIDVASPAHKKNNLPPTYEFATELLYDCFPMPSCIVDSGHGLQAYWILETWCNVNADNREDIQNVLRNFSAKWRSYSATRGFDADSVCDLSRVMRLPGSLNTKVPNNPATVTIYTESENLYSLDQIQTWWTPEDLILRNKKTAQIPKITDPKPAAPKIEAPQLQFPEELFGLLKDTDVRFEETWNLQRPDLLDQSASAYTIALGRLCMNAGMGERDTEALLTEFRRRHGWEIKPHAIKLTIQKIKDTPSGFDIVSEQLDNSPTFETLSKNLGFTIDAVIRYNTSPPAYVLISGEKRVMLGGIDGLSDMKKFRNTIASNLGVLPRKYKGDAWDVIVSRILPLITNEEAGCDTTEEGQMQEYLQVYLSSVTVHEDAEAALTAGEPWKEDGSVFILATAFRGWVAINLQDKIDARRLGLTLRALKATPEKIKSRNVWRIHNSVLF